LDENDQIFSSWENFFAYAQPNREEDGETNDEENVSGAQSNRNNPTVQEACNLM
jgi:hypothetical protein